MAPLSSLKARHASWKLFLVLLFTILLVGPSSATSRGFTTLKPDQQRLKHDASSNNPGLYFSMKPKGKPVPPSGPSKGPQFRRSS
ncbi:protein IDA [Tanacetum coccineum]|uniref:Protein IDA n=1 Tax=Tanacetum coccineum TaxID=301880 RepID=A0ABQ5EE49_9ASTR